MTSHDGRHRQTQCGLVAHHLRRRPHRAQQRVLRPRRPPGQHHTVNGDRAHSQEQQDPDGRVGHLQVGGATPQLDFAAVAEVPSERNDGEGQEGGDERQVRRQLEHEPVRPVRHQVLLEEELDPVGEGLQDAEGPGDRGPEPLVHTSQQLPLEPDHQRHGHQQEHEGHDNLGQRQHDLHQADVARQHGIGRQHEGSGHRASTFTTVTSAPAAMSRLAGAPGASQWTFNVPAATPASTVKVASDLIEVGHDPHRGALPQAGCAEVVRVDAGRRTGGQGPARRTVAQHHAIVVHGAPMPPAGTLPQPRPQAGPGWRRVLSRCCCADGASAADGCCRAARRILRPTRAARLRPDSRPGPPR